jgi:hypothetical protein
MDMKSHSVQMQFAICIQNQGCDDLELRKVYRVLADDSAARDGYIRVIDESGEDYLYPASFFIPVALPEEAERALLAAVTPSSSV